MNTRVKITRLDEQENSTLTLEECQEFFAEQPDFSYHDAFSVTQNGVNMKIKGDFFMWQVEGAQIPFRLFDGEIYVAISHPIILDKTKEIAEALKAVYVEG